MNNVSPVQKPGRGRAYTEEGRDAAFWARVDKAGPVPAHQPELGNCWLWRGSLDAHGYGQLKAEKMIKAHHYAAGHPPAGLVSDHLCRTKSCVRPTHIEFVTLAENTRRYAQTKQHCPQGHPINEINTHIDPRTSWRNCRVCDREQAARYYQRRKATKKA